MQWSNEIPKTPGWYWVRSRNHQNPELWNEPYIDHVFIHASGGAEFASAGSDVSAFLHANDPADFGKDWRERYQFYGPITPPA